MNGIDSLLSMLTSPLLWLVIVILLAIKKAVHFVPQNRGYVIYTLGRYSGTLSAGLNFLSLLFKQLQQIVTLKSNHLISHHNQLSLKTISHLKLMVFCL